MIRARIVDVRMERRVSRSPLWTHQGGFQEAIQDFGISDIELRIQLVDYDGHGVSRDALRLVEQAIEQALNGPPPTKPVPLDVALPPGPRKITL